MTDHDLDQLASELAEFAEPVREAARSPLEERVVAGFEEIQRWVTENGRPPTKDDDRDIFERLYAVRLDRIRSQAELRAMVESADHQGLLTGSPNELDATSLSEEDLAAELEGIDLETSDLTHLRHVRSRKEIEAAEDIATRRPCADFESFRPLFDAVQADLKAGIRQARSFGRDGSIEKGQFFIVNGQVAYVAERGEDLRAPNGAIDARLRVIFSNGTESNLLLWSLQRALYKDAAGRRITQPDAGPLFAGGADGDR